MLYTGDAYGYGRSHSCVSSVHFVRILVRLLEAYRCVPKRSSTTENHGGSIESMGQIVWKIDEEDYTHACC